MSCATFLTPLRSTSALCWALANIQVHIVGPLGREKTKRVFVSLGPPGQLLVATPARRTWGGRRLFVVAHPVVLRDAPALRPGLAGGHRRILALRPRAAAACTGRIQVRGATTQCQCLLQETRAWEVTYSATATSVAGLQWFFKHRRAIRRASSPKYSPHRAIVQQQKRGSAQGCCVGEK